MSVKVIQSRDHILNTYSEKISEFAEVRSERRRVAIVHIDWSRNVLFGRNVSRDRISRLWRTLGKSDQVSSIFLNLKLTIGLSLYGSVKEVFPDRVIVTLKDPKDKDAKPVEREIPAGFVLWSTGIGEWALACQPICSPDWHSVVMLCSHEPVC
jgi:hypothetical protein